MKVNLCASEVITYENLLRGETKATEKGGITVDWGKRQRFWSVKHGKDLTKGRRKEKHWLIHSVLAYLYLGRCCSKYFRSAVLV